MSLRGLRCSTDVDDAVITSVNARLRHLADDLPSMMMYQMTLTSDRCPRFSYVSQSIERLHEISAAAAINDPAVLYDQVLPDYRPGLHAAEEAALREMTPFRYEVGFRLPSGRIRWAELNAVPTLLADGHIIWDGVEVDITQRKRAEDALRQSEERFRSLVQATAAIVWDTPPSGQIEQDQPQYRAFTGQTWEQVKGWGWLEAIHPDDRARTVEVWKAAVASRSPYRIEHRLRRHDGVYRHMSARAVPLFDAAGEVREWIGVHNDVEDLWQAEQSLVDAAEQRRLALESADMGTWDYHPATGDVRWDERCRAMFGGCAAEKCAYAEVISRIHPDDQQRVADAVSAATAPGSHGVYEIEFRVPWLDGSVRWLAAKGQAFHDSADPAGAAVRMVGTVMDTTDRKQAMDALHESEEHFRTLADNIAPFAWMADASGGIFWYNKRWYDYTGTTLDEMKGWGWQKVHHPDHLERVVEKFKACVEAGHIWEDLFPLRSKAGVYRWFLSRAVPIRDEQGKVLRWFGTNTDVTEQRQAEERLRESRALYRSRLAELQTIYASAPIGLCVLDRDYRYVRINERLAEMDGLSIEDHIGRTLRDVVPDLADQQEAIIADVINSGRPVTDVEISGQTRATPGLVRAWLMSYFPLPNDAGEIVGVNATAQEITDRKRSELQRQELLEAEQAARAELERYNRLKDEFLATVSHELRSPLNAILGWTRLLIQGKAESGRALEIVERNASGLAQIVEDLLDMSRIISGKIRLQRSFADVGQLARNVLDSVALPAQAKGITVDAWIDPNLRPLLCDANRVQQIMWNLLTNAVKFTPGGGRVWLNVAQETACIQIRVKDTGQGIAPEFLDHIFGRFQQADSSTTRKHGGLGLGLAIVKQLVELHGGTVEVHSEGENKGAMFTARLPSSPSFDATCEPDESGVRHPFPSRESAMAEIEEILAGLTIAVVDDDPDSCELAARILREAGADVQVAHSAEEGFALVMEVRPDVLISDISMPQQDGLAFVRKIRSCGGWCTDLVCIALTALSRPEDRTRVLAAGYDEYLSKPFDATVLLSLVTTLTARPEVESRSASAGFDTGTHKVSPAADEESREADGRHILLAEDNQAICEMLRLFLEGSGYRVTTAPTVEQALAIFEQQHVHLLLSDFRLKDGTAWDLLGQLRKHREVPAVILSGYSDQFYIDQSKAVGFSRYLVKPVDEDQLLTAIQDTLAAE